jgi:hypothetical protein
MTPEQSFVATVIHAWKLNIERADKFFLPLTEEQLLREVAPGKNRLIYLFGHLVAVHDAMLPLLGIGPRRHPELDAAFLTGADRTVAELPSLDELKRYWHEVNGALLEAFERFTAADWIARHTVVSAEDFAKNPLRNRLSVLLSRTSHIGYHLGQAALSPR